MVLIHDRIIIIDICNFEMSYKTPEKSLKSNQIYSVCIENSKKCIFLAPEKSRNLSIQEIHPQYPHPDLKSIFRKLPPICCRLARLASHMLQLQYKV